MLEHHRLVSYELSHLCDIDRAVPGIVDFSGYIEEWHSLHHSIKVQKEIALPVCP